MGTPGKNDEAGIIRDPFFLLLLKLEHKSVGCQCGDFLSDYHQPESQPSCFGGQKILDSFCCIDAGKS